MTRCPQGTHAASACARHVGKADDALCRRLHYRLVRRCRRELGHRRWRHCSGSQRHQSRQRGRGRCRSRRRAAGARARPGQGPVGSRARQCPGGAGGRWQQALQQRVQLILSVRASAARRCFRGLERGRGVRRGCGVSSTAALRRPARLLHCQLQHGRQGWRGRRSRCSQQGCDCCCGLGVQGVGRLLPAVGCRLQRQLGCCHLGGGVRAPGIGLCCFCWLMVQRCWWRSCFWCCCRLLHCCWCCCHF